MSGHRRIAAGSVGSLAAASMLLIPGISHPAPPGNDNFGNRTIIGSLPFSETVSTVEATTESGEPTSPCAPVGKTVWYQYSPPSDMVLGANANNSDFDAVVTIWTGSDLSTLTAGACGDDPPNVVFKALAGTTYLIQVGGFDGAGGSLGFRLREVEAGFIAGTVTEEGTGRPLADICVSVQDADLDTFSGAVTDEAGAYSVPVRPGVYLVLFEDFCDGSNDHRTEWFDDAPTIAEADEVEVSAPATVPVDATLARACPGSGSSNRPQFLGTDGPDTFRGGPANEVFCGFGGRDRLIGGGGNDDLSGGDGADLLSGRAGRDFLEGGRGSDTLAGGPDHDALFGDTGDDRLRGGPGKDFCRGEAGLDESRGCDRKGLKA
jgi:Ca2+-binding RTX toxin-like protein